MKSKVFLLLAAAAPICAMAQMGNMNPGDVFKQAQQAQQAAMQAATKPAAGSAVMAAPTAAQKAAILADLQAHQKEVEQRITLTNQSLQKANPFTQPSYQADLFNHNAMRQNIMEQIARVQAMK